MRQYFLYVCIIVAMHTVVYSNNSCLTTCDCQATSKSYLAVRPVRPRLQETHPLYTKTCNTHNEYEHSNEKNVIRTTIFGSQSTNPQDLARYFFPFCKTTLIAAEQVASPEPRDLLTQHFNIFTRLGTFRSQISIEPRQSVAGLSTFYRHRFWDSTEKQRGFWASIYIPFMHVKNSMQLDETIVNDGGGANQAANEFVVATMTEALKQADWRFGKIICKPQTKTGIADIECKLGYEWHHWQSCFFELYGGLLIPTGNKTTGAYIFEPIVGYGKHANILTGCSGHVQWCVDHERESTLRFIYTVHATYLFPNIQCRSFDLKYKPWSRYMQVYFDQNQAVAANNLFSISATQAANFATAGINVFTKPLRIRPGFIFNLTTAIEYAQNNVTFDFGYNLFSRHAECVSLVYPWKEQSALKHVDGRGRTNPFRTITGNAVIEDILTDTDLAHYNDNIIKETDLDLLSAAQPSSMIHMFFSALSYRCDTTKEIPVLVNGGVSYEFTHNTNAAINRWTLWSSLGCLF